MRKSSPQKGRRRTSTTRNRFLQYLPFPQVSVCRDHTRASSHSQAFYRKNELFYWHQCVLDLVPGLSPSELNIVHPSLVHWRVQLELRWIPWNFTKSFAFFFHWDAIKMYNMTSLELWFVFNLISFVCITVGSLYLVKVLYCAKPYLRKRIGSITKPLSIKRTYLLNALSVFYYYCSTWHLPKALRSSWEVL